MQRNRKALLVLATLLAAGGVCFQAGGCGALGLAQNLASTINPCGTILECDPATYLFLRSDIDGPGLSVFNDPYCTYPPFCTAAQDPIFGGLAP